MNGQVLLLILGAGFGVLVGWLISRSQYASQLNNDLVEKGKAEAQTAAYQKQLSDSHLSLDNERDVNASLRERVASAEAVNRNLLEKLETQKQELAELQKRLTTEFENLANRILDEKSRKFTEQNRENIATILSPLQDRIREFQKKVEDT